MGMATRKVSRRDQPSRTSETFVSPRRPAPVQATTAIKALRMETQARMVAAADPLKRRS